jgi:hypothetical protein
LIYFLRGFRGINTDEKDTGKKDEKKFEQEKNGLGEYLNIKASILEKKKWISTSIFFSNFSCMFLNPNNFFQFES